MSLKQWKLTATEVKRLDRARLMVLAARAVLRSESYGRPVAGSHWDEGVTRLLAAAAPPPDAAAIETLARQVSDLGMIATQRSAGTDDAVLGRCAGRACVVLAEGLRAAALSDDTALRRAVRDQIAQAGAIPAMLAHGGLHAAPDGVDPVDDAAGSYWDAVRRDIAALQKMADGELPTTVEAIRRLS